jgi:histone-lysine N-methyltransferase SETMAR
VDRDALQHLLEDDRRQTTRQLAAKMECSKSAVENILHELGYRNVLGQFVPHLLSASQLEQRVTICNPLLSHFSLNNYLRQIISGDEKWVRYVNHTRKRQWIPSEEEPEPEAKVDLHQRKVMLSVFWDYTGIIHWELLAVNTTVTAEVYCRQLDNLRRALNNKRPKWAEERGKVRLLHDNARPHVAKKTRQKLEKFRWHVLPHPAYSPDLNPTDYHLFSELARHLKEKQFDDYEEVRVEVGNFFNALPAKFFEKGIWDLPRRWETVIESDGAYVLK